MAILITCLNFKHKTMQIKKRKIKLFTILDKNISIIILNRYLKKILQFRNLFIINVNLLIIKTLLNIFKYLDL